MAQFADIFIVTVKIASLYILKNFLCLSIIIKTLPLHKTQAHFLQWN